MKPWVLKEKLDELSSRMPDFPPSESTRIDSDCLTEGERLLFQKVYEIIERYGANPPSDVLEENAPFLWKGIEVLRWRALDLFRTSMKTEDPIRDWYFNLHLVNFLAEIGRVFRNLDKWTERDRQDFLKHQDLNKVFIFPRLWEEPASSRSKDHNSTENKRGKRKKRND